MIRVMIVEDDFMVAEINRDMTNQVEGFAVVKIAATASEALDYLDGNRVDLVILDVYLPDQLGIEILKTARKKEYPVDFILITAAHDARTVEDSLRYGIIDYLIKPFDMDRYRESLTTFAARRASLESRTNLDQKSLDEVRAPSAAKQAAGLPKGIAGPTLEKIQAEVPKTGEGFGVDGIAGKLGLSRITAHRYLEYLARRGILRKEFEYQKVGRPAVVYRKV